MKQLLVVALMMVAGHAAAMDVSESRSVTYLGSPHKGMPVDVINVACAAKGPTCTYQGKEVPRRELVSMIPKGKWGWCRREFCYNSSGLREVIGLNPEYFIYPYRQLLKPVNAVAASPGGTNLE